MLCLGDESLSYNCSTLISQIVNGSPRHVESSQMDAQPANNSPQQMPSSQINVRQVSSPMNHITNSQEDFNNLTQRTPQHSPSLLSHLNVEPAHNSPNAIYSQSRFDRHDNSQHQMFCSQSDVRQVSSPTQIITNSQDDFHNLTQRSPNHSPTLLPHTSSMTGVSQQFRSSQNNVELQGGTPTTTERSPKRSLPDNTDDQDFQEDFPSQSYHKKGCRKGKNPQRLTQWSLSGIVAKQSLSILQKYLLNLMAADPSERKKVR